MNAVLFMVASLLFIVIVLIVLIAGLLFLWWNLPCAEGD
jgi:hypothetical protein